MRRLRENFTLVNGVLIPKIGFGTWLLEDEKQCIDSVTYALKNGYTHIDTAADYYNEKSVGQAIKAFPMKREDVFISTKLSGDIKDVDEATAAFKSSLKNLQVEYLDLYLIHSPIPWDEYDNPEVNYDKENLAIWKLMEEWYRQGLIRAIGVSNFSLDALTNIINHSEIVPHVHQICYYIGCVQPKVVQFCEKNQIQVVGHSPLANGELLDNQEVRQIASKYNKTLPQLCIAFALQNNIIPLPKSTHEKYIIENTDVDFIINDEDMNYLTSLVNTIPDCEEDYL